MCNNCNFNNQKDFDVQDFSEQIVITYEFNDGVGATTYLEKVITYENLFDVLEEIFGFLRQCGYSDDLLDDIEEAIEDVRDKRTSDVINKIKAEGK